MALSLKRGAKIRLFSKSPNISKQKNHHYPRILFYAALFVIENVFRNSPETSSDNDL